MHIVEANVISNLGNRMVCIRQFGLGMIHFSLQNEMLDGKA